MLLLKLKQIFKGSDYANRVDSSKSLKIVLEKKKIPSNPLPFLETHPDCKIITFVKDSGWKLHHRDGVNHTEGDVLKYFDKQDVEVTGELVLNTVRYLAT